MWRALLLFIIFISLIYYIYTTNPAPINSAGTLQVQGILVSASLDEIFNKIIPSQKIDLVRILSSNKTIIWSADVQLNLASTYYDINNYILIIRTPQIVRLDNIQIYVNEIEQRLEYLLKRPNIVISLTDVNGNNINNVIQYSFRSFYIFLAGILVIGTGLYIYVKIAKKK
jgi:hypothetical protein